MLFYALLVVFFKKTIETIGTIFLICFSDEFYLLNRGCHCADKLKIVPIFNLLFR